jgi:hypothetical protein
VIVGSPGTVPSAPGAKCPSDRLFRYTQCSGNVNPGMNECTAMDSYGTFCCSSPFIN